MAEQNDAEAAPPEVADDQEEERDLLDEQADLAEDLLDELLDILDLDGEPEAEIEDGDLVAVEIFGEDLALLIGRHGAALEALQDWLRAAVQQQTGVRVRLLLDIAGYRQRQQEMLERRARSVAARVAKTGKAEELDPMSSFERRIVHTALVDFDGVTTTSEGEDPERRVVILPDRRR